MSVSRKLHVFAFQAVTFEVRHESKQVDSNRHANKTSHYELLLCQQNHFPMFSEFSFKNLTSYNEEKRWQVVFLGLSSSSSSFDSFFDTKRVIHKRPHDVKDFKTVSRHVLEREREEVKWYGIVLIESWGRVVLFDFIWGTISNRFSAFQSQLSFREVLKVKLEESWANSWP